MSTVRSVKLIKNADRKNHAAPISLAPGPNANRWFGAVRSWVADFQARDRREFLPAFDSLFKDAPSPSPGAEPGLQLRKGKI